MLVRQLSPVGRWVDGRMTVAFPLGVYVNALLPSSHARRGSTIEETLIPATTPAGHLGSTYGGPEVQPGVDLGLFARLCGGTAGQSRSAPVLGARKESNICVLLFREHTLKYLRSVSHRRLCTVLVTERETAGLTQRDLAGRLKRPPSYVAKIEIGERRIDVLEFIELAKALKVDPKVLFAKVLGGF